jgi:basic membrane protein A
MTKKLTVLLSVVMAAAMLLVACAPAATAAPAAPAAPAATTAPAAPAAPAAAKLKVCMVTDSGGIGDKSFNDLTWKGVQDGIKDFGVDGKYIQSKNVSDFDANLAACKDDGASLIICVGFMMADSCQKAATANPKIYYAGVDMGGFNLPNFRGVTAKEEQSCYLAGYLAAGMTKTGILGWYTGIMGPAVQIFGDGWYYGAQQYNKVHGTSVKVIGYDPLNPGKATVTGSWTDADKGRSLGASMMDEGADIILPVAGGVGAATAAVMKERGKGYIIGVDQDWTQTYPAYLPQILVSVLKSVDVHVYDAIKRITSNTWEGGDYVLTLANGGTALAYNSTIAVPDALKAEVADLAKKIISGEITIPAPVAIK